MSTAANNASVVLTGAPLGRIGRWELVDLVNEGSLGRVYRARPVGSPDHRPPVYAVKVLRERFANDPRALAMFCREVQLGRTVANAHLISILAAGLVKPP
ncbi:MAG: hypothetical protein JW888_18400, partial [Pirellulales bacterium]|nr:hypothetical protein [Pirellulales bacterium]